MTDNRGNPDKASEQRTDQDMPSEKTDRDTTDRGTKQQSGRSPARPPYEQYLRVRKVVK